MRTRLFFNILVYCCAAILVNSLTPYALAMSKRPKNTKQSNDTYILPEIEIISQPEANRQLLLGEQPQLGVSPTEVLPAVGKDAKAAAKGYRTSDIQKALHNAGFRMGSIDGKMGPKTKKAIQDFQKENDLTADGIVGKKTWTVLKLYLNQPNTNSEN